MTETFYELLDVAEDATTGEITDAFRAKVRENHPDRSDRPDATERMRRINRARDVLTDETERRRYDRMGHRAYVESVTGSSRGGRAASDDQDATGTTASAESRSGSHRDGGPTGDGRARDDRAAGGSSVGRSGGRRESGETSDDGRRRTWDPWAGRDPFDDDGPFGGGPFGGDPFDGDYDRDAGGWAPNWDGHAETGRARETTAEAGAGTAWTGNAWDAARGRDPTGSWRASTAQDFEWSDEDEVRDRTETRTVADRLGDWTSVGALRSPLFVAWCARSALSTVLAAATLGVLAAVSGPVAPTAGLVVVLGAVVVAFGGYEAAIDRIGGLDADRFRPRASGRGSLGRVVAVNLASVALLSVATLRGGDLFGLAYAVPAAVDGLVLFCVVAPTVGLAVGTFLSSFLVATLGHPFGDLFDEMIALGTTAGFLLGYAAVVLAFCTRLGGGLPSVRTPNPSTPWVAYPWIPAIELGPLYVGGVMNFLVSLALVGTLLFSAASLARDVLSLPWTDRYVEGRAVRPTAWDLGLALPAAALAWTTLAGVDRLAPALPTGLASLAGTRIPLPFALAFVVPDAVPADALLLLCLATPTLLAGGYALRRGIDRRWDRGGGEDRDTVGTTGSDR